MNPISSSPPSSAFSTPTKQPITQSTPSSVIKEWPVIRDEDGIRIDISPDSKRNLRDEDAIIYRFKCGPTLEHDSARRYAGSTCDLTNRISNYHFKLNKTRENRHIENALRKYPEEFTFGIVAIAPRGTSERDLLNLEGEVQDIFQSRKREFGFNKTDPRNEPLRRGPRKISKGITKKEHTGRKTKSSDDEDYVPSGLKSRVAKHSSSSETKDAKLSQIHQISSYALNQSPDDNTARIVRFD